MWMTVKELAAHIKIKEKTIYHLVSTGEIPHYRIGKLVRFKQEEIDSWMETKKAQPMKTNLDKIPRSFYTPLKGRPGHLTKKEVIKCSIKEVRSGI